MTIKVRNTIILSVMKKLLRNAIISAGVVLGVAGTLILPSCSEQNKEKTNTIRIGHFPNVTHAHALVARNMARNGNNWFAERVPGYTFEWFVYNAGPSAMEAFFAKSIDLTYVGPSPAINAFAKSKGAETRIVAGAVNGASALVVRPDFTPKTSADFLGKIISTPQLGNTQDISCRAWLKHEGFTVELTGAVAPLQIKEGRTFDKKSKDVDVIFQPMANPEILSSFVKKRIDAAWTVEPWISRMESEANGKIFIEENDAVTTVLAARVKWMEENPLLLKQMVEAHRELTRWIIEHPEEAQQMVADELEQLTKTKVSRELINNAWKRMVITNEVSKQGIEKFVKNAQDAGLLDKVPPVDQLIHTSDK